MPRPILGNVRHAASPSPASLAAPRPGGRLAAWWRRYWHTVVLGCWGLACFARFARHGGVAWHFFTAGSALLFGGPGALPGGLHLYANYPQLQIGPLAFVVTEGLRQPARTRACSRPRQR